jgi:PAS domain-containing protein
VTLPWVETAEGLAKIVGGGAALAVVARLAWKAWRSASKAVANVSVVLEELRPNTGHSLRDAVDRVESHVLESSHVGTQRWRASHDLSTLGHLETDSVGRLTWANRTYREMVARDMDELKGFGWINAVTPAQRDFALSSWTHAVREGRDYEERIIYERANGRICCVVHAQHLERPDGTLYGHVGTVSVCPSMAVAADLPDGKLCRDCHAWRQVGGGHGDIPAV